MLCRAGVFLDRDQLVADPAKAKRATAAVASAEQAAPIIRGRQALATTLAPLCGTIRVS